MYLGAAISRLSKLPTVWHTNWAYLQAEGIAPVWLGEFGGQSTGRDPEGV